MAMTDWTIIRRSMTSRLFSTVTTVITVAIAVGLMLTLLSMRDSGRRAFERGSGNMHMLISNDSSPLVSVLNGIFYANAPARAITPARFAEIANSFPAEYAIPTQLGDRYMGLPVLATTREFFTKFSPNPDFKPGSAELGWKLAEGRIFEAPFEVVVGARAAREANVGIGDQLALTHGTGKEAHVHRDFLYKVVGILEPTGASHDRALFTDLTSSWIIHAYDRRKETNPDAGKPTEADLTDADKLITGIYARIATRPDMNISAMIPAQLAKLRADGNITVASPSTEIQSLFRIVGNIDQILIAMAAAVMVASSISIMLALYNSMEQRRRQIAVLRVLGCSRPRVFGLVVTESAIIGMLGGLAGFALAFIGTRVVAAVLKEKLGLVVEPIFDPRITFLVLVASLGLAALAGLIPAAVAYRTSVARNLRPTD
ncbi:MAG: ABC transporter permease [Phycisphaerales bacterium]|nr:ABC transporter permease [Phycisphaerales bacterium]MCB9836166.1 ABC transporter permease [Phycisphaera sp.]